MWARKQNNSRWHILPLFFAITLFLAAPCNVQSQWGEENGGYANKPALKIVLPSRRGFYYVQPFNIILTHMDKSDGLVEIRVDVTSNPTKHQHVFSARFAPSAHVVAISSRLRLAGKGKAEIKAVARTRSGQEITATGKIKHKEGVDFSDASSLTKRLPPNVYMLKGPIGTAKARLSSKKKYTRHFQAIIYHPMLPRIGEQAPNLLDSMEVEYRDKSLCQIKFGDAISNDPYIAFDFTEQQPDFGRIRVQWKDGTGKTFEPEKVSVK